MSDGGFTNTELTRHETEGRNGKIVMESNDVEGGKPSLLTIHGAWADKRVWAGPTEIFTDNGLKTYNMDLPGHGESDPKALRDINRLGVDDYVDAVREAVLYVLERESDGLTVMGHSLGAFVLMKYLEKYGSDGLKNLIFMSPIPEKGVVNLTKRYVGQHFKEFVRAMISGPDLKELLKDDSIARELLFLGKQEVPDCVRGPESFKAFLDTLVFKWRRIEKIREQIRGKNAYVLTGECDGTFPYDDVLKLSDRLGIDRANVKVFFGGPHYLQMYPRSDGVAEEIVRISKGYYNR